MSDFPAGIPCLVLKVDNVIIKRSFLITMIFLRRYSSTMVRKTLQVGCKFPAWRAQPGPPTCCRPGADGRRPWPLPVMESPHPRPRSAHGEASWELIWKGPADRMSAAPVMRRSAVSGVTWYLQAVEPLAVVPDDLRRRDRAELTGLGHVHQHLMGAQLG